MRLRKVKKANNMTDIVSMLDDSLNQLHNAIHKLEAVRGRAEELKRISQRSHTTTVEEGELRAPE